MFPNLDTRLAISEPLVPEECRIKCLFRWLGHGMLVMGLLGHAAGRADEVSKGDPLLARLSAPMDSVVEGKPFREAILGIAKMADVNVCLDRGVDPTGPVKVGTVGPTVFAALAKVANQRGCVVMPMANVLLVGRQGWVDQTAASVLALNLESDHQDAVADVHWPALTTPLEAIQIVSRFDNVTVTPPLGHDLWSATTWKQVDRRVALVLILAQFDRRPQSSPSVRSLRTTPADSNGRFTRRYQLDPSCMTALRSTFARVDRRGSVKVMDGWLVANGTVGAHRAAIVAAMVKLSELTKPVAVDQASFAVRMKARASDALMQLSQKLGKRCVIEPSAATACEGIVTMEGEFTLKTLIESVAEQAEVKVIWKDDQIIVTK